MLQGAFQLPEQAPAIHLFRAEPLHSFNDKHETLIEHPENIAIA